MPRIIAIDYGTKRVGLAVTDPLQIIATPLDTIHSALVLDFLKKYVATEEVEAFVLGMPLRPNGEDPNIKQHIVGFQRTLEKTFPDQKVYLVDEKYTSKMASQTIRSGGLKRKDVHDKSLIDKISATILLQTFMEFRNFIKQ